MRNAGAKRSWARAKRAKINTPLALEHLRERLDSAQRYSMNGLSTRLDDENPAPLNTGKSHITKPVPKTAEVEDTVESLHKRQKLRQAQLQTLKAEKEEPRSLGQHSGSPRRSLEARGRAASPLRGHASRPCERGGGQVRVSGRDMLHCLQTEYKRARAGMPQRTVRAPKANQKRRGRLGSAWRHSVNLRLANPDWHWDEVFAETWEPPPSGDFGDGRSTMSVSRMVSRNSPARTSRTASNRSPRHTRRWARMIHAAS
jgi:hypothetical protein